MSNFKFSSLLYHVASSICGLLVTIFYSSFFLVYYLIENCILITFVVKCIKIVDPRVEEFFMMSSPFPSLLICILYVYAVEIGLPNFMEKRKPLNFRSLMVAYNFAMVALSGYIFVEVG